MKRKFRPTDEVLDNFIEEVRDINRVFGGNWGVVPRQCTVSYLRAMEELLRCSGAGDLSTLPSHLACSLMYDNDWPPYFPPWIQEMQARRPKLAPLRLAMGSWKPQVIAGGQQKPNIQERLDSERGPDDAA